MNINRAIHIATEAHRDQTDKVNKPYITHVMRVMERCKTDEEKIVAALHDVVEDCGHQGWTIKRLREEQFSATVVDAVDAITQRENESKMDYIERVKQNPLAVRVKLNDLEDNMDIRRLPEITDRDVERLRKYLQIYRNLLVVTQDQISIVI